MEDIDRLASRLVRWCGLHKQNVRIYVLENKTGKIKTVIFPDIYKTTVGNSDKRGLFLHENHFQAVVPQSCNAQDDYMNDLSVERFINLCKRAREDHDNEQQLCGICFRTVKLSDSHIVPYKILCMATKDFHQQSKCVNPKRLTTRLLCHDSSQTEQGCEQMLESVESELYRFLAGPNWNTCNSPTEVDGGLIYSFQEAVNNKRSVQFTITMNHWHALISIAYRILITWPQQLPDEQARGRLAKKLHHLTIFPYDDETVYMWLLLSADGTKAIERDGLAAIELLMHQVVLFAIGNDKKFIVVHFGIRGLHFIVTEQQLQCAIPITIDYCFEIPYRRFEQNNAIFSGLLQNYETLIKFNALASSSSKKVSREESPEISGNTERLPSGFMYDEGDLKLAKGWTMLHKVDITQIHEDLPFLITFDDKRLFLCITMWILKDPTSKLNVVLHFTDNCRSEYVVFGYSINSNGKIKGPMLGTKHTGTPVNLNISPQDHIESFICTVLKFINFIDS